MQRVFVSATALTVSHLRQVTQKMGSMREEELLKVDQAINSYLARRRESQQSSSQDNLEAGVRSGLVALEEKNEWLLKELQVASRTYQQQVQAVQSSNAGILDTTELVDNPWEELCREILAELAQSKGIGEWVQKMQQLKIEGVGTGFGVSNAQEFFERVEDIVEGREEGALGEDFLCQYGDNDELH